MKSFYLRKPARRWPYFVVAAGILLAAILAALWYFRPADVVRIERLMMLRTWFTSPGDYSDWLVYGGARCGNAPMLIPTTGFIGVDYGDSFRPGHVHSGFDIFSPDRANNVTPILAAYDGYLTRESTWRSTVIIRHPNFPAVADVLPAGQQIWTYYTHMAAADGSVNYVSDTFPPGTFEVYVEAGTLLGYQGTWSGNPAAPTGLHLHFSIVRSLPDGNYANETNIENTYNPAPFLGVAEGQNGALVCTTD